MTCLFYIICCVFVIVQIEITLGKSDKFDSLVPPVTNGKTPEEEANAETESEAAAVEVQEEAAATEA